MGSSRTGTDVNIRYYKRDFWSEENLKFATPHYRLRKSAAIVSKMAGDRPCDLLDIGCGPGTLATLLGPRISYFGIDIAVHEDTPNVIEADFLEAPISFHGRRFDIVVAQGVFEYMGTFQEAKFAEINRLLKANGRFLASYVNFDHRARNLYWPYSNIQSLQEFRASLARHFTIEKYVPTSHNWNHSEPGRRLVQVLQPAVRLPVVSRYLAVEYFFVCSQAPRHAQTAAKPLAS